MQTDFTRHLRTCGIAALLAVSLTACATSTHGTTASADAGTKTPITKKATDQCRTAITEVTRICDQNASSSRCADAKSRSRDACI
ncbi:MAG: hypothetical protein LBV36_07770 [Chromatiales bacterium]|nr:hypothetical protein [Chromatiales bacterium]